VIFALTQAASMKLKKFKSKQGLHVSLPALKTLNQVGVGFEASWLVSTGVPTSACQFRS